MTIAAGFRVANGVLIGADTRIEEGNVKYEENKVFDCRDDENDHSYAVLFAGAGDFEAISHCASLLRGCRFSKAHKTLEGIKGCLRRFVESNRYLQLNARMAGTMGFAGLFAIQSSARETDLLYLSGENLYPIPEYKCIGAGSETALFVSKWLYRQDYPIHVFMPMAIQVFRAAKGHNAGCDDTTKIVRLYNKGSGLEPRRTVRGDTDYLWGMHDLVGSLIRGCFDLRVTTQEFNSILRDLHQKASAIREANEHAANVIAEGRLDPQSTIGDPTPQPPSQEKPEGSGES
jgi:hypothetical protein